MKYRKKFLAILLAIIIVSISFFVVFNLPASSISPDIKDKNWLAGWDYRKSHTIQGSVGAGTDYQIKITVHYPKGVDSGPDVYLDAKCQKNFGDVRFTSADGLTVLNYWVETTTDGDQAVFWVKINDNLDFNQTIYLYYGNATVSSASNMAATFPFSDDFSGNTLNASNWQTFGSGKITIGGGECTLESVPSDRGWIYILGKTLVGTDYSIRFRSLVIEQGCSRWTHHGFATIYNDSDNSGGRIDEFPNYITASQEATYYAWTLRTTAYGNTTRLDLSNDTPAAGVFYTYEIQRNGTTNVVLNCNDVLQGTISTNIPTVNMGAMFSADSAGSTLYSVTVVDWVFIHKSIANEPQQGNWNAEETILAKNLLGYSIGN